MANLSLLDVQYSRHPILNQVYHDIESERERLIASGFNWDGADWSGDWTGGQWSGGEWSGGDWTGGQWSGAEWSGGDYS